MSSLLQSISVFGFRPFKGLLQALNKKGRYSSLDVWRGLAALCVVITHFHKVLYYGFLGVDLFFVLSGFLVGGIMFKQFDSPKPISFFKFITRRGFKIWPSYYLFLGAGLVFSFYFIKPHYANEHLPISDILKYALFYINYDFIPHRFYFAHSWSLAVEEHFYLLLPLVFIGVKRLKLSSKALLFSVICMIIFGVITKVLNFNLHQDGFQYYTYSHLRMDGLAWGVLLAYMVNYHPNWLANFKYKWLLVIVGVLVLGIAIYFDNELQSWFFTSVLLHTLAPFGFVLFVAGTLYMDFNNYTFFRSLGYYSYNWYLWHPLVNFFYSWKEPSFVNLLTYLVLSFLMAIVLTICIEEPFLKLRKRYLN